MMKLLTIIAITSAFIACSSIRGPVTGRSAPNSPSARSSDDSDEPKPDSDKGGDQKGEKSEKGEKGEDEEVAPKAPVPSSAYSSVGKALRSRSEAGVVQETAKVLARDSKDLKGLNALAVVYILNRKLDMAKIVLARAIKAHPNDPTLACNMGIIHMMEDHLPEAILEFQRALGSDQSHVCANYHLGAIHIRYKNANAAVPLLARAYGKLPLNVVGPHYAEALRMSRKANDADEIYKELRAESTRDAGMALGYASLLVEELKDKQRGLKMINRIRLLTDDAGILKQADDLSSKAESLR